MESYPALGGICSLPRLTVLCLFDNVEAIRYLTDSGFLDLSLSLIPSNASRGSLQHENGVDRNITTNNDPYCFFCERPLEDEYKLHCGHTFCHACVFRNLWLDKQEYDECTDSSSFNKSLGGGCSLQIPPEMRMTSLLSWKRCPLCSK